ncbi:hypothetical protein F2Q68_00016183 [Brassica cretica]|uniref:Uncharacterized protein n=1 Tax=Brassica cretica TaxID=69181 RepID=A0A8S9HI59_BRACR|nr:hypothetical protein F2Q68_00016183 [Brassica cretica]
MVAIVILRQDENGNLYDQDGHLRNATGQKLDAQGTVIPDDDATEAAQPVEEAAQPRALGDYNRPDEYYTNRSAIRLLEIQKENFELKPQYYTLHQGLHSPERLVSDLLHYADDHPGHTGSIDVERGVSVDNEGRVSVDGLVRESVDVKAVASSDVER